MKEFDEFISKIADEGQRERTGHVVAWTKDTFPQLEPRFAWSHPMFTHHGTFIISYSPSKKHLAVSPELAALEHFSDRIKKAGYSHGQMILRIPWDEPVDYDLLREIIEYNIEDKKDCASFWRHPGPNA